MKKIFLVNIGVNASHGKIMSPIFKGRTFVYVPIPEDSSYQLYPLLSYSDIFAESELRYIPRKKWILKVHHDPEFTNFTYGDSPMKSARVANLKHARRGDYIFFLARLVEWNNGKFISNAGFFLIGYFELEHIFKYPADASKISNNVILMNNAHMLRKTYKKFSDSEFWIFKGSQNSRLFKCAVPFTKEFACSVMRDRLGNPWIWDSNRSNLQIIGSYTRSCRIINNEKQIRLFWEHVKSIKENYR